MFFLKGTVSRQIQRQPLFVQYKQQANLPLSMHKYTPLVISGNNKNKQLTLISQLSLSREIHFLRYEIIEAPKN